MAANKENTAPRTPPTDEPANGTDNFVVPVEGDKARNPGEEVQVPSTALVKPDTLIDKPQEVRTSNQAKHEHADDIEEPSSDSETIESQAAVSDLPEFDWEDLQRRYVISITAVNKAEDEILEEFYKYSDAFSVWGGAAANRDNERAAKRLKTRERFVRLGEASLEEKKKHYAEVVDAFKKALELLRR